MAHGKITPTPPTCTVDVTVERQADSNRYAIGFRPPPSLPEGPFRCDAAVVVVDSSGVRHESYRVPVLGTVQPEIRMLPARVLFGQKPVGEVVSAEVVIQAPIEETVVVERVETDSADVHVETVAVEGILTGRAFRISQSVTKKGDQATLVRFIIRRPGQSPRAVTVEVCYRGAARDKAETRTGGVQP